MLSVGTRWRLCRIRPPVLEAFARAFRWKRILKSGEFASIADTAERERIAASK
jgi:hypothetical protein